MIDILLPIMREAGAVILAVQQSGLMITTKNNGDIVTKADLLVNDILKSRLMKQFPADGWLSEENKDDFNRLTHDRVWIVDPIDGTREFAQGIPEYAISVALIENKIPIVASVFNPATDELFYAVKNQGAWLGNKKIHCTTSTSELLILASRSEYERGEWNDVERYHQVQPMGSIAYKLARVAAGDAQATFSLSPRNEWDIAAGVLLVTEAGGMVTNKHRQKIMFNNKETKVDGLVATTADVNDTIFDLIARVGGLFP